MTAFVDRFEDDVHQLKVVGWAFASDETGTDDEWIRLVACSEGRCYSAPCVRQVRNDVVRDSSLERNDPGFEVVLEKRLLRPGRYRLGLLLGGPAVADGFHDLGLGTSVGSSR